MKITKSALRIDLIVSERYHLDRAAFMALDQNERPFSFDLMNSHSTHLLLLRGHKCTCGTADSSLCQANKRANPTLWPNKVKETNLNGDPADKKTWPTGL